MTTAPAVHGEARRRQILAAARTRFQEDGFHGTTMKDVAREAGLSAGTLYLYFDGKDDLIRALAASGRAAEEEILAPLDEDADPVDALERVIVGFLEAYQDEEAARAARLLVRYWGEALSRPALQAELRTRRSEHVDRVSRAVGRAQDQGRIDPRVPRRSAARLFLGVITAALLERSLDPDADLAGYAEAARSLLRGELVRAGADR